MVAHVDKVVREEVDPRVAGAGDGLVQAVGVEDGGEEGPDGEAETVEDGVPGARREVRVECAANQRLEVPE